MLISPKKFPRPTLLQVVLSSHSWTLAASFVGTAARAVAGAGQVWFTRWAQAPVPLCSWPPHLREREMEGMGYGPRRALPLTCAPPLFHFPQRPGMSPGSRMPMAGLQVGPPAGSPFGTAAPLRPGMPPTMMDPFRKRLLVPQAQPPMPAQRRG